MKKWREVNLGEIAEVQTGPFGSQLKNEQYIIGGTPVVTVEHINDFRIIDFDYPSITEVDRNRLSKYLLKAGDIVCTRVGSVDLSAYVKKHQDGWLFSSRMLRVRPNNEVDSRFLSYYFQQKNFREHILNISVGATMPSINTEILKGLPVSYPSMEEQKAIASVLSSLDDKIDLLHRQNKTLEAMAETLFRQWFVEEADDSWEEGSIGSIGNVVTGKTPSTKRAEYWGEYIPFITPTDYKKFGKYTTAPERYLSESGFKSVERNLIPPFSILVTCIGSDMGKIAINTKACITNQQINSLIIDESFPSAEYVYQHLKYIYPLLRNIAHGGTTMPIINKSDFSSINIAIPPKKKLIEYQQIVEETNEKILLNQQQIQNLSVQRDTLLPKLMSGEVELK